MTQKEFNSINWCRGNVVKLENGKEYLVKGTKGHGRYLLLYSLEHDSTFVADYRIVDSRTSDYEEPEEVYLELKRRKQEEAQAKLEAERQERLKAKAELKQKHLEEQERIHLQAVAAKEAKRLKRLEEQQQAKKAKAETIKAKADTPKAKTDTPKAKSEAPNAGTLQKRVAGPKPQQVEAQKEAKTAEPTAEAPKKRVRQRVRIASIIREKVDIFKKK